MPDPKKQSAIDQMVEILRTMVTEPITDQSSMKPTAADVQNVKAALNPPRRRKAAKKARPKAAPKKKRATTHKTARPKGAHKKSTARTVKRKKTARK